jgi:hypothetical protein
VHLFGAALLRQTEIYLLHFGGKPWYNTQKMRMEGDVNG